MQAVDLDYDRTTLNDAVREAGQFVLSRFGRTSVSWSKADKSPVSEVDHKANEILHQHLIKSHGGGYGFLSEESVDDLSRLTAPRTWIVDPIDGTRAFLNGKPEFTICAALMENGRLLASAIYNPATEEFFEAGLEQGAKLNGRVIKASDCCVLEKCSILGHKHLFSHPAWSTPWPKMDVSLVNSTSYRLALVAAGQVDAALALINKSDWDVAPGALIAQEAGAIISDHRGEQFIFNKEKPIQRSLVCAAPNLYSHVLNRIQHLPADFTPSVHFAKGIL